jgi:hypothetical protein
MWPITEHGRVLGWFEMAQTYSSISFQPRRSLVLLALVSCNLARRSHDEYRVEYSEPLMYQDQPKHLDSRNSCIPHIISGASKRAIARHPFPRFNTVTSISESLDTLDMLHQICISSPAYNRCR